MMPYSNPLDSSGFIRSDEQILPARAVRRDAPDDQNAKQKKKRRLRDRFIVRRNCYTSPRQEPRSPNQPSVFLAPARSSPCTVGLDSSLRKERHPSIFARLGSVLKTFRPEHPLPIACTFCQPGVVSRHAQVIWHESVRFHAGQVLNPFEAHLIFHQFKEFLEAKAILR
jgi:hypothetical protein